MKELYLAGIIVVIVGLFIAGTSYSRLLKTYKKYNTRAYINITAGQFVAGAFSYLNLKNYKIAVNPKPFSDAYVMSKKLVVLSEQNVHSKTISALAVAAHEVGHVMQHASGSKLFSISYLFQFLNKIADLLLFPSLLVGGGLILFSEQYITLGNGIFFFGILLYVISLLFKFILIPLEFNASRRALNLLKTERILDADELKAAKKVLRAAAYTYVGSIFYNLYRFLRGVSRSFD
jgi:Zn-dependent membrane protease YugP